MTTLREAAQQALEALEYGQHSLKQTSEYQWESRGLLAMDALKAALAEPTVKESLQVEPAIAETATTQQQVEQTPPSEYRRGYWAGFEIGKREGRIEAEDALAEPVQEPVECEPQYANEDGWCDWVCPKPQGYLMQCCDCDLIHEVESRVAKYQPRPSEEFEVVDDPDLQVQWRMKRRDDISPKQPVQDPVAWRFQSAVGGWAYGSQPPLGSKYPAYPLYTSPPQRKPLTEEQVERAYQEIWRNLPDGFEHTASGWIEVAIRYAERVHGITNPVVEEDKAPHPEDYEITVLRQQIATYQTALDDALRRKHGS